MACRADPQIRAARILPGPAAARAQIIRRRRAAQPWKETTKRALNRWWDSRTRYNAWYIDIGIENQKTQLKTSFPSPGLGIWIHPSHPIPSHPIPMQTGMYGTSMASTYPRSGSRYDAPTTAWHGSAVPQTRPDTARPPVQLFKLGPNTT